MCGASAQNVQCTKAGTAGGRKSQSKVNTWQVAVSIWVSHLQTFWSQRFSPFGQQFLRHSSDVYFGMSQNTPDKSWCECDCFLFWWPRSHQLYALLWWTVASYTFVLFYYSLDFSHCLDDLLPLCSVTKYFWCSLEPQLFCFGHCYISWNHIIMGTIKFLWKKKKSWKIFILNIFFISFHAFRKRFNLSF